MVGVAFLCCFVAFVLMFGSFFAASAGGARRMREPCAWRCPWWVTTMQGSGRSFINKLAGPVGSATFGGRSKTFFSTCRGDEVIGVFPSLIDWRLDLHQGSVEAAPGSAFSAVFLRLPTILVEGRPLPPSSTATVSSGWRLQVKINLQAVIPKWRPLCTGSVGSRCLSPSGHVPGGELLDCAVMCSSGGVGAGPDCFSFLSSRVLSIKRLDLSVIFFPPGALLVFVASLLNESF
jgi:hypothetical protein